MSRVVEDDGSTAGPGIGRDLEKARDPEAGEEREMLSPENAEVLLDEFEGALGRLDGDDGSPPPEFVEETRRLLDGLDALPGPDGALEDRVARVRAWTEVLLADLPPARHPGPGSPIDVVKNLLLEIREHIHDERTGLGT